MVNSNGKLKPTSGDRWLLASAMQKAIRRGDVERASGAAYGLWLQDRRYFWQRLLIVSLEDVGVGDVDVLVNILNGIKDTKWRRQVGDLAAGLHLVSQLCTAPKSRLIDSVYIQASLSQAYREARYEYADAKDSALRCKYLDEAAPIIERALAIWLLAGTKKYPCNSMPPRIGSIQQAVEALCALSIPKSLGLACMGVVSRLAYPLPLHIPLIWQEVQRSTVTIRQHTIPATPAINGLPLYAADGFTRVGKACFRELQKTVHALQTYTTQQIALGVFYIDGGLVDRELSAPSLDAMQLEGEQADIISAGLNLASYAELRSILVEYMPLLTKIRHKRLKLHLRHLRSEGQL